MKLFLFRYIKITFLALRLHLLFGVFTPFLRNLLYLTRFSKWAAASRGTGFNDFPSKWDYNKRYELYRWVIGRENLKDEAVCYLEFGVAQGESFRWFLRELDHPGSRFHGFDTFTGLPEDWGTFKKGDFDNKSKPPEIHDPRGRFHQGLFQQTLPGFLSSLEASRRMIIMLDADLYSATLYVLGTLAPFLKKGDIIFFDEFAVPSHEFKAFDDFMQAWQIRLELIGAANNYYFTAFRIA